MAAKSRKTTNQPQGASGAAPAKKPVVVSSPPPAPAKKPVVAQSTQVKQTERKRPLSGAAAMGAGPGRPKGIPNKMTIELRDMIRQALDAEGGVEYLRWASRAKPESFMSLVGRILPTKIEGDVSVKLADLLAEAAGVALGK